MISNKFKQEDIIYKLKNSEVGGSEILTMSDFAKIDRQRVFVCLHKPDHIGKYHTHDFFEINYMLKGSGINLVEDDSIPMLEGDMIIMQPGAFHNLYAEKDSVVCNFLIDKKWLLSELSALQKAEGILFEFFNASETDNFYKYVVCPVHNNKNEITTLTSSLINSLKSDSSWKFIHAETAILQLLDYLSGNCSCAYLSSIRGKSSKIMIEMLDFVTENCSTVDLKTLSDRYFYSKTHICRLFLKNTGKSFNTFLMDIKIGKACSMLESTDMTVNEISESLGYESVEYFYRLFKRKKGLTPKEYRKKYYIK